MDAVSHVVDARRVVGLQSRGVFEGAIAVGQPLEVDVFARDPHGNRLRRISGAVLHIGQCVFNLRSVHDKHLCLVGDGLALAVDGDGQRDFAVGQVLLARGVHRHGDAGIVEGAIARGGPSQVVVVDGVAHDLGVVAFADGHVVASGAGHDALGGQPDVVDPAAVATAIHAAVFGIGPFIGVSSGSDRVDGLGPADVARPCTHLLVVDIEVQLVIAAFRRHLVIEGDGIVRAGLVSQSEGGGDIADARSAALHAVGAFVGIFCDKCPRTRGIVGPAFTELAALEVLDDEANLGDIVFLGVVLARNHVEDQRTSVADRRALVDGNVEGRGLRFSGVHVLKVDRVLSQDDVR